MYDLAKWLSAFTEICSQLLEPPVQHMVQEDVRKKWADHSALWSSSNRSAQSALVQHPCVQPLVNHASVDAVADHHVEEAALMHCRGRRGRRFGSRISALRRRRTARSRKMSADCRLRRVPQRNGKASTCATPRSGRMVWRSLRAERYWR